MSIDDGWGEALRKSAEKIRQDDKAETVLRTRMRGENTNATPLITPTGALHTADLIRGGWR